MIGVPRQLCGVIAWLVACVAMVPAGTQQTRRFLYVATPGAENQHEYAGVGILVFDIDNAHRFVKRIPTWTAPDGQPDERVRGIAAHVAARRLFISTVKRLAAFDLETEKIVWEKSYDGFCCDRFALSPDGSTIYAPAFGSPKWYVIKAATGELVTTIPVVGWPRQTVFSRDGSRAFLGAWESMMLTVVDTSTHTVIREVGPFGSFLCPFTINRSASQVFANVDGLVGFEVGDLRTGLILDRVLVEGYQMELAGRYECPSHGIGFSPNEQELWVADGVDNRLHVFDSTTYPPVPLTTIEVRAQPRWITFGSDGRFAYASSGDVIDRQSRSVVTTLEDEKKAFVQSEKMIEVEF